MSGWSSQRFAYAQKRKESIKKDTVLSKQPFRRERFREKDGLETEMVKRREDTSSPPGLYHN